MHLVSRSKGVKGAGKWTCWQAEKLVLEAAMEQGGAGSSGSSSVRA